MSKKAVAINYALTFIGVPYHYGGNNPLVGFDCSGLVCEVLKSVGVIKSHEDFSARELRKELLRQGATKSIETGAILFFGKSKDMVSHVAVALDESTMIESGGGDASTVTREAAQASGAMVRIRPIRADLVDSLLPNYG